MRLPWLLKTVTCLTVVDGFGWLYGLLLRHWHRYFGFFMGLFIIRNDAIRSTETICEPSHCMHIRAGIWLSLCHWMRKPCVHYEFPRSHQMYCCPNWSHQWNSWQIFARTPHSPQNIWPRGATLDRTLIALKIITPSYKKFFCWIRRIRENAIYSLTPFSEAACSRHRYYHTAPWHRRHSCSRPLSQSASTTDNITDNIDCISTRFSVLHVPPFAITTRMTSCGIGPQNYMFPCLILIGRFER